MTTKDYMEMLRTQFRNNLSEITREDLRNSLEKYKRWLRNLKKYLIGRPICADSIIPKLERILRPLNITVHTSIVFGNTQVVSLNTKPEIIEIAMGLEPQWILQLHACVNLIDRLETIL